jgi:inosine-uridine nucleoside N-ribohydrolase
VKEPTYGSAYKFLSAMSCEQLPVFQKEPFACHTDAGADFDDDAAVCRLLECDREDFMYVCLSGYESQQKARRMRLLLDKICKSSLAPPVFTGIDTAADFYRQCPMHPPKWRQFPEQCDSFVREFGKEQFDTAKTTDLLDSVSSLFGWIDDVPDGKKLNLLVLGPLHDLSALLFGMKKEWISKLRLWVSGGWFEHADDVGAKVPSRLGYNFGVAPNAVADVFATGVEVVLFPPFLVRDDGLVLSEEEYRSLFTLDSGAVGTAIKEGVKAFDKAFFVNEWDKQLGDVVAAVAFARRPTLKASYRARVEFHGLQVDKDGFFLVPSHLRGKGFNVTPAGELFRIHRCDDGNVLVIAGFEDPASVKAECYEATKKLFSA